MPSTLNAAINRGVGVAAVWANNVLAGTIESSSGNASETPAPRRKVRRGICLLVMNMLISLTSTGCLLLSAAADLPIQLERGALDDAQDQRRKAVVVRRRVVHDGTKQWHISVFDAATQGIRHQPLGHGPHKLRRIPLQQVPETRRT